MVTLPLGSCFSVVFLPYVSDVKFGPILLLMQSIYEPCRHCKRFEAPERSHTMHHRANNLKSHSRLPVLKKPLATPSPGISHCPFTVCRAISLPLCHLPSWSLSFLFSLRSKTKFLAFSYYYFPRPDTFAFVGSFLRKNTLKVIFYHCVGMKMNVLILCVKTFL